MTDAYRYSYYEKLNGESPVREFVNKLRIPEQVKLEWVLKNRVAKTGPRTPSDILHMVSDFYQIEWCQYRVLCLLRGNEFVLLHAFRKKSKKTKDSDINKARGYADELSNRRK